MHKTDLFLITLTKKFALVFSAMFYRSLFVLLSFSFWPLCCLSFV